MAYTRNGNLKLSKTDIKNLQTIIEHIERDISYDAGGTFCTAQSTEEVDHKAVRSAQDGVSVMEFIIGLNY